MADSTVGSVLVVEDEGIVALDLRRMLMARGYTEVKTCASCEEARELLREDRPVAVVMDIGIQGDQDGVECAEEISREFHIPVVYATGHTDGLTVERALATEPFGYLVKPLSADELHLSLQTAITRHLLEFRIRQSEERFRAIFDHSPIPIAIYDENAGLIDANQASLEIFGVSSVSDIAGYCMYDDPFLSEEQKEAVRRREPLEFSIDVDFSQYTGKADIGTDRTGRAHLKISITPIRRNTYYQSLGYLVQIVEKL